MKAVRVHAFGGPEQLVLDDLDEPRVRPSEVLVEIHAAGVNPVDAYVRTGTQFEHEGPAFQEGVHDLTDGRGVSLIVAMLANQNLGRDLSLLARNGRVVVVGSRGSVEINPRELMIREAAAHGVFFFGMSTHDLQAIQEALAQAFSVGSSPPVVANAFPLADAPRAREHNVNSGCHGRIVLSPSN